MARTVADCAAAVRSVLAGYDDRDPLSAPVELRSPSIKGARIGVSETFYDIPVQPAVRRAGPGGSLAVERPRFRRRRISPRGLGPRPESVELLLRRTAPREPRKNGSRAGKPRRIGPIRRISTACSNVRRCPPGRSSKRSPPAIACAAPWSSRCEASRSC